MSPLRTDAIEEGIYEVIICFSLVKLSVFKLTMEEKLGFVEQIE
ncbi:MAG: hypothetical protein ACP5QS_06000 [bacterium]